MKRGFTIVEILIVIVVIAILATVSLVAYTSFTSRAHNSATVSMVKQAQDALEAYHAAEHHYPRAFEDPDNSDPVCLGKGFPDDTCGHLEITCGDGSSGGDIKNSDYFDNALKDFLSSPLGAVVTPPLDVSWPVTEEDGYDCAGTLHTQVTGAYYTSGCYADTDGMMNRCITGNNDHAYGIIYMLKDSTDCGVSGAADNGTYENWRQCTVYGDDGTGQL